MTKPFKRDLQICMAHNNSLFRFRDFLYKNKRLNGKEVESWKEKKLEREEFGKRRSWKGKKLVEF